MEKEHGECYLRQETDDDCFIENNSAAVISGPKICRKGY